MTMQYQWTEWDEDVDSTPDEEYQSLVRSLRRKVGFGLFFVRCSPVGGQELIKRVRADVPQKQADVLELKEPIANLIDLVKVFPNIDNIKILFIVGLEKSLVEYIRTGYGGQGDYYNLDTVPPILSHLNWQRENFRDKFRHVCFVFLLPRFAIKYIIRRAPDFFDWGSGKTNIPSSQEVVAQESQRILLEGDYQKYLEWTPQKCKERIIEIDELLLEPVQNQDQQASLLLEQGNIFVANNQNEEAIACFDRALEFKPDYYKAWLMRSIVLGEYEEVIATLDKALTIKSEFHEAWYIRGIALSNLGRYEEAITCYDKALEIKPDHHGAWYNRGIALGNLGRNEEAITCYDKALEIKPNHHEAWYNQGCALGNLGRNKEAIAAYDQALQIKPDFPEALNNQSVVLDILKFEEMIATYEAEQIKPDYHNAWHKNFGNALYQMANYQEAVTSYDQALRFKPDDHEVWNNRGVALSNLGRYEEAIASYDRAVEIKSDYQDAWYNRGIALRQLVKIT
jgi:tetratricopeptide (TPR) repeat protein